MDEPRVYTDRDITQAVDYLRSLHQTMGVAILQEAADKLELLDGEVGSLGLWITQLKAENAALRGQLQTTVDECNAALIRVELAQ